MTTNYLFLSLFMQKIVLKSFTLFTPRSLLRMGYCCHSTGASVCLFVRPYVSMSAKNFDLKWYFCFFGIIISVVLDNFKNFWKKKISWAAHALFCHFLKYIKSYLGRAANQGIYTGFVYRFWIYIVVRPWIKLIIGD